MKPFDSDVSKILCSRFGLYFAGLTKDFTLSHLSPGMADYLATDAPEGVSSFRLFPELAERKADIKEALGGGGGFSIPRLARADGAACFDLHVYPLPRKKGTALLVVQDITRKLEADRSLQQAHGEVSLLTEMLRRKEMDLEELEESHGKHLRKLRVIEKSLKESRKVLQSQHDRMTRDLLMAEKVQRELVGFVPPEVAWMRTAHTYRPLEEIGGDFMTLMKMEENSYAVFIGDVTGHGVTAALFIALLKSSILQVFREFGTTPDRLLERLNEILIGNLMGNFVTGIYGILCRESERSARFVFASGGHPPPAVVRTGGSVDFPYGGGMLMGVQSPLCAKAVAVPLYPGDRLFLYTDGLPETRNENGGMIGFEDGLAEMFASSQAPTLDETHARILDYCDRFRSDTPLSDDITILSFEVTGAS